MIHVTGCALGVERRGQCFPSKAKGPAEPRLEWVLEEYTASNVEGERHATRRDHRSRALPFPLFFSPLYPYSPGQTRFSLSPRAALRGYRSSIFPNAIERKDSPPSLLTRRYAPHKYPFTVKNFILEPMDARKEKYWKGKRGDHRVRR